MSHSLTFTALFSKVWNWHAFFDDIFYTKHMRALSASLFPSENASSCFVLNVLRPTPASCLCLTCNNESRTVALPLNAPVHTRPPERGITFNWSRRGSRNGWLKVNPANSYPGPKAVGTTRTEPWCVFMCETSQTQKTSGCFHSQDNFLREEPKIRADRNQELWGKKWSK